MMVAKTTLNDGSKPGEGLGKFGQGIKKPIQIFKNEDKFGLGYKPNRADRMKAQAEKKKRRLARLEGRDLKGGQMHIPQLSKIFCNIRVFHLGHIPHRDGFKKDIVQVPADDVNFDHISNDLSGLSIQVIEEEDLLKQTSLVYPCHPDTVLNYWKAMEILMLLEFQSETEDDTIDDVNSSIPGFNFNHPINIAELIEEDNCHEDDREEENEYPELMRMVEHAEKQIQPHQESVEMINLGDEENKRKIKIGTQLSDQESG